MSDELETRVIISRPDLSLCTENVYFFQVAVASSQEHSGRKSRAQSEKKSLMYRTKAKFHVSAGTRYKHWEAALATAESLRGMADLGERVDRILAPKIDKEDGKKLSRCPAGPPASKRKKLVRRDYVYNLHCLFCHFGVQERNIGAEGVENVSDFVQKHAKS